MWCHRTPRPCELNQEILSLNFKKACTSPKIEIDKPLPKNKGKIQQENINNTHISMTLKFFSQKFFFLTYLLLFLFIYINSSMVNTGS